MKLISLASACLGVAVLAACSGDPQAAADRRDALTQKVFPNPADRQGIFLTFPLESGGVYRSLEVMWHPSEVSQAEVTRRVQGFCLSQASARLSGEVGIKKDMGTKTVTLAGGQQKSARDVFFTCL